MIFLAATIAVLGSPKTAFAQSAAPAPNTLTPTVPVVPSSNTVPSAELVSTAEEDIPVMLRPRPEFDPIGIPIGSFLLFPQLGLDGSYDTNVFRTATNDLNDYFFTIAPSVKLKSQWNRGMLEFYGGMSDYQYAKYTQESLADWDVGADGRYDIVGAGPNDVGATSLYANGSISELHELLSSPNTVGNQKSPNRYYNDHGEIDGTTQPGRLGFSVGGVFDRFDYLETPLNGGGFINNTDRNFDDYQGYAKSFYDFSPGYSGFVRATYESRDFDQHLDRTGVDRSSNGYKVDGGVDLQISHLVSGEVYLGALKYDFAAPLRNLTGIDYGVQLDWLATPLMTVHLTGGRTLTQVVLPGTAIMIGDSVGASADYELRRNIIIQAHATYVAASYPGLTRHDAYPDLGIGVKYLLNRHLSLNASYDYTDRTTDATGEDFRDSTIMVGINLQQ
jgi:hypothetical protein